MQHVPRSAVFVGLIVASAAEAAHGSALTCLTGTDPRVANDFNQIKAVRAQVDTQCPCSTFDGSPTKTHAAYSRCASGFIGAEIGAGHLRTQCKATVKKYYSASTCGQPASKGEVPCIKKTAAGRVSCSIKPTTRCAGSGKVACPIFASCSDAADTNGDGIIGAGDSGACASSAVPTVTPTQAATPTNTLPPSVPTNPPAPTSTRTPTATFTFTATFTPAPRFVDNGDGTITDNQTGLMWEKQDQAGDLHDVGTYYPWAGLCGYDFTVQRCQPDASAAAACAAGTGSASTVGCTLCANGGPCIMANGNASTTIWGWLVQLNQSNFAGHSDWRIPSVGHDGGTAQLETILDTSVPGCGSGSLCVPAAFNTGCTPGCNVTGCSCTGVSYWSATIYAFDPDGAWSFSFSDGFANAGDKTGNLNVRAVR